MGKNALIRILLGPFGNNTLRFTTQSHKKLQFSCHIFLTQVTNNSRGIKKY